MATFIWQNEFGPGRHKGLTVGPGPMGAEGRRFPGGALPPGPHVIMALRRQVFTFTPRPSDQKLCYITTGHANEAEEDTLIRATTPYIRGKIIEEGGAPDTRKPVEARGWHPSGPDSDFAAVAARLPFIPMADADTMEEMDSFRDPDAPAPTEEADNGSCD